MKKNDNFLNDIFTHLVIDFDESCENSIFFTKDGSVIFEYDKKLKYFYYNAYLFYAYNRININTSESYFEEILSKNIEKYLKYDNFSVSRYYPDGRFFECFTPKKFNKNEYFIKNIDLNYDYVSEFEEIDMLFEKNDETIKEIIFKNEELFSPLFIKNNDKYVEIYKEFGRILIEREQLFSSKINLMKKIIPGFLN